MPDVSAVNQKSIQCRWRQAGPIVLEHGHRDTNLSTVAVEASGQAPSGKVFVKQAPSSGGHRVSRGYRDANPWFLQHVPVVCFEQPRTYGYAAS